MRLSYLVWFLFLAVVSWQDFQKQEIYSWLLILMGALGTVIQLFEGSVSLGGWFGGIFLGLALLFPVCVAAKWMIHSTTGFGRCAWDKVFHNNRKESAA